MFLAMAGHAAAAELFGSLGFMFADLPLSTVGLCNSDLHFYGETNALCGQDVPRCFCHNIGILRILGLFFLSFLNIFGWSH